MARQLVARHTMNGVAQVALDDPDRRNVLSPGMVQGIVDAFDAAESDPGVRCVVLAARGPAFCAGAELGVLEASARGDFTGIEDVYRGFLRVASSPLPTVAVVDGPAVGAGFNLALACDLRIASGGALFDARFAALRLLPGGGHTWMLDRAVGRQAATAISLFGERLDAAAARVAGLVWNVYPDPAAASEAAVAMAARLDGQEKEFVTSLTRLLRSAGSMTSHQQAVEHERFLQRWSAARPGFLAGVRAMRAAVERPARSRPGSTD
jgi:enoyl-CoA hydratase